MEASKSINEFWELLSRHPHTVAFLTVVTFAILFIVVFRIFVTFKILIDDPDVAWSKLKERVLPVSLSILATGISIEVAFLFVADEFKSYTIYIKVFLGIVIYVLFFSFYEIAIKSFSKRVVSEIEEKNRNDGVNYKAFFNTIFNFELDPESSLLQKEVIQNHRFFAQRDVYFISLKTYLSIIVEFLERDFTATGFNYILPPVWYSPKEEYLFDNNLNPISSYIKKINLFKEKITRVTIFKDNDARENTVEAIFKELKFNRGAIYSYRWLLNLLKHLSPEQLVYINYQEYIPDNFLLSRDYNYFSKSYSESSGNTNPLAILDGLSTDIIEQQFFSIIKTNNLTKKVSDIINNKFIEEVTSSKSYEMLEPEFIAQYRKDELPWRELVLFAKGSRNYAIGVKNEFTNICALEVIKPELVDKYLSQARGFLNRGDLMKEREIV